MTEVNRVLFDTSQPQRELATLTKKFEEHNATVGKTTTSYKDIITEGGKYIKTVVEMKSKTEAIIVQFQKCGAVSSAFNTEVVKGVKDIDAYTKALHNWSVALKTGNDQYKAYLALKIADNRAQAQAQAQSKNSWASTLVNASYQKPTLFDPSNHPDPLKEAEALKHARALAERAKYDVQAINSSTMAATAISSANDQIIHAEQRKAEAVKKANEQILLSWHSIVRIVEAQVLFRLISETIQELHEGIRTAEELSIRIGEIQTISQRAGVSSEKLTKDIIGISKEFGAPVLQVAEGYYQAISNQIVTAANATDFMREEMKLATTTVATLDQAVNATTSVLNAYGLASTEAARVNAVLFKGVDIGRFRLDELSDSLGRTSVFAKQLGMSLEEQFSALTILTRMGIETQRAQTFLANVQMHLIKPTKELTRLFHEWGVTSGEMAVKTFTFAGVLQKLADEATRSGDRLGELGKIMQDMRALAGGAVLVGFLPKFKEDLKQLNEISGEQYKNALKLILETPGKQLQLQTNQIKLYFTDLGESLLKNLLTLSDIFGGLANTVKTFVETGKGVAATLIIWKGVIPGVVTGFNLLNSLIPRTTYEYNSLDGTIIATTASTRTLSTVLKSLWLTAGIPAAIFAATEALLYFSRSSQRAEEAFRADQTDILTADKEKYARMLENQTKYNETYKKKLNEQLQIVYAFIAEVNKENNRVLDENKKVLELNAKLIGKANQAILADIDKLANDASRQAQKAASDAQRALEDIERMKMDAADRDFDNTLTGKSSVDQVNLMIARYKELNQVANEYLASGRRKEFDEAIRQRDRVYEKSKKLIDKMRTDAEKDEKKTTEKQEKEEEKAAEIRQKIWNDYYIKRMTSSNLFVTNRKSMLRQAYKDEQQLQRNLLREATRPEKEQKVNKDIVNEQTRIKLEEEIATIRKASDEESVMRMKDYYEKKIAEEKKLQDEALVLETKKKEIQEQFTQMGAFKLSKETPAEEYTRLVQQTELMMQQAGLEKSKVDDLLKHARLRDKILHDTELATKAEEASKQLAAKAIKVQEEYNETLKKQQNIGSEIQQELAKEDAHWTKVRDKAREWSKDEGMFGPLLQKLDTATQLSPTLDNLKAQRNVLKDVVTEFEKYIKFWKGSKIGGKEVDISKEEAFLDVFKRQYDTVSAAIKRWETVNKKAIDQKETIKQIDEEIKKIPKEYMPAINKALEQTRNEANQIKNIAEEIRGIIQNIIQLGNAVKNPNLLQNMPWGERLSKYGFTSGGRVHYMAGGGPTGTDRIPAMLAKGEYVWDARTTAQYYPMIRNLHQGGRVTNIGDINVSVRGGDTSQATIREIANGLRREIRRGTVQLN